MNPRTRLMMMTLLTAGLTACTTAPEPPTQVITGTVTASDAIAVRAVDNDVVVTAAQVRSDGSFTLSIPLGTGYHLEVLSAAGVQRVSANGADLAFSVCAPGAPWNMGGVGPNGGNGGGNGSDPTNGGGNGGPTGGNGGGNGSDPTNGGGNGGGPPNGGNGGGNGSDPTNGGNGGGNMGNGGDPTNGSAMPPRGTDPNGDPCSPPPPPCEDPTDTNTCQDPCVDNAANCGCGPNDPTCWPPPNACDPTTNGSGCDPTMPIGPQNPPGNFGCGPNAGGSASS